MPFNADGTLRTGSRFRPNQPLNWRGFSGTVLHHMLDYAALCDFWNGLIRARNGADLARYIRIIGCRDGLDRQANELAQRLLAGSILELQNSDRMLYDTLDQAVGWQRYNLFEGPSNRPSHAPDPTLEEMRQLGASPFDFPIVVPPHGERANTLWRAYPALRAAGGAAQCLPLLEPLARLDVIPAYDVNWFALPQKQFWALTPPQRQQFYQACDSSPRPVNADQVYARLFRR